MLASREKVEVPFLEASMIGIAVVVGHIMRIHKKAPLILGNPYSHVHKSPLPRLQLSSRSVSHNA